MRWRGPRSHPWPMSTNTVKPEALIHEPEHRVGPYQTALCRPFRGRVVTGVIASAILAAGGAGIPRYLAELPARSSSPLQSRSWRPAAGSRQMPASEHGSSAFLRDVRVGRFCAHSAR